MALPGRFEFDQRLLASCPLEIRLAPQKDHARELFRSPPLLYRSPNCGLSVSPELRTLEWVHGERPAGAYFLPRGESVHQLTRKAGLHFWRRHPTLAGCCLLYTSPSP